MITILIIMILILLLLVILFLNKRTIKQKEKREESQIKMMDQKLLKPAEISLRTIKPLLQEIVWSSINAINNNDSSLLLKEKIDSKLYNEILKEILRYKELKIERKLLSFEEKSFSMKQNNSQIYTVSEITVDMSYVINTYLNHFTFKGKKSKTIEQYYIFKNTNEGLILSEIGKENIISETDFDK